MVLNFKNDINDFEDWYYTEKKLKKHLPKYRILNINRWYKNLLKLDNNFEVEKQVIISDNILKVIAGNFERVIDDDFKIVIDNKKIFIIKDDTKYDTLPKVIIPISAITKSYTEDEFLGKFNNVEIINIK